MENNKIKLYTCEDGVWLWENGESFFASENNDFYYIPFELDEKYITKKHLDKERELLIQENILNKVIWL